MARDPSSECAVCPPATLRCAHWGSLVVRLYPPVPGDPRLEVWGVEGPGVIDPERSRREGASANAMYIAGPAFSGRHESREHAELDFETRAEAMRRYEPPEVEQEHV